MASGSQRLDRFLSRTLGINRREVKPLLAQGRILVDNRSVSAADHLIDEFSHITFDARVLQAKLPIYLMLHKPVGFLSATTDPQHTTVIDLLHRADKNDLHIVGRLDRGSSGLLLLTNDGRWSRALMAPEHDVPKVYLVTLQNPLTPDYEKAFAEGMYFDYEDITTRPVRLEILEERLARVTLVEGRYHQIKRMFGRFRNPVLALHRTAIGNLQLDPALAPGQSRELTAAELKGLQG
ncbi:MAG: 16S rRNA pseudouridine(516) synthase [Gammaproteobacteria bacterium]|nr:16S rRNA pseudouridine(516) synthase [Gammaproteobacteria bacterium]